MQKIDRCVSHHCGQEDVTKEAVVFIDFHQTEESVINLLFKVLFYDVSSLNVAINGCY